MGKKSSDQPAVPDFSALATQQAELNKASAEQQTAANRPNQSTPWGTSQWTQDPSGKWSQNVTLDPADQTALEQQRGFDAQKQGISSDLLGKAGDTLSTPLDLSGLPALKDFDFSKVGQFGDVSSLDAGFGGVEDVQKAMMGRLDPARQQSRESEIQRLKNQGIPEGSDAFQRAMTRLDQGDTDAQQQALLASMGAYGDIFNRGLAKSSAMNQERGQQTSEQSQAAQLAGMLRQQSLGEQQQVRQSPLDDFIKLTQGINPKMPQMPSFMGAAAAPAADIYGAGKDQYSAAVDQTNAQNAQKSNQQQGLMGLVGSLGTAAAIFF